MRRRRLFLAAVPLVAVSALAACQAPPPPAATPQNPAWVVFFTEDSAALNAPGLSVVKEASAAAKASPNAAIFVLGYAGPAGGQAFNQALSETRARHVADLLIAEGVPTSRISIRPRGPTPFEMMPTESRRVEIRIGG